MTMDEIKTCNRCGRKLITSKSLEREYGPVCYQKHLREQAELEFQRRQLKIEELGV